MNFAKHILPGIAALMLLTSAERHLTHEPTIDRNEALAAFEYLNKVRQNPDAFSKSIGISLKSVKPARQLTWNDTLAKVAEQRALDMIKRDYFAHVNPDGDGVNILIHEAGYELNEAFIDKRSVNYFESLQAGYSTAIEIINDLIVDEGESDRGHRKHLLGIDESNNPWNSNLIDIGIGIASSPDYEFGSITSVIIAKHDW